jgi:transposase
MPSRYSVEVRRQVVELARSGTRVAQLVETFGMTQASIYSGLKQDRIDRGEAPGLSTEGQMELGPEGAEAALVEYRDDVAARERRRSSGAQRRLVSLLARFRRAYRENVRGEQSARGGRGRRGGARRGDT